MDAICYKVADFEGPLDLLLTLISKNKMNIYDINITELLSQYMQQIELFKENNMDVASEFLEMAARLVYIKSAMLLPKYDDDVDPRAELSGELLEYQVCKEMAARLSQMTDGFNRFVRLPAPVIINKNYRRNHLPEELLPAYLNAIGRGMRKLPPPAETFTPLVAKKIVSVSSKVVFVLRNLRQRVKVKFSSLFEKAESRSELVATFLAVLELIKTRRVKAEGDGNDISIAMCSEVTDNDTE